MVLTFYISDLQVVGGGWKYSATSVKSDYVQQVFYKLLEKEIIVNTSDLYCLCQWNII